MQALSMSKHAIGIISKEKIKRRLNVLKEDLKLVSVQDYIKKHQKDELDLVFCTSLASDPFSKKNRSPT